MKYFTLLLSVFILLGCSQENSINESLNFITGKRAQETLSEKSKKYIGVFGHNTNKELHGKITIYENIKGIYEAEINLVNGKIYLFTFTDSLQKNILKFKGESGSFNVDINDPNNPLASNVFIKSKTPGYIKLIKKKKNILQVVVLGTYEETGNEANFYGNWDLIGTEDGTNFNNNPNSHGPELPYFVSQVIVSHKNNATPFIDSDIEEYLDSYPCSGFNYPTISSGLVGDLYLVAFDQSSHFAGHQANWQIAVDYDDFNLTRYFLSTCEDTSSGTWSWNGKNGTIYCEGPPL